MDPKHSWTLQELIKIFPRLKQLYVESPKEGRNKLSGSPKHSKNMGKTITAVLNSGGTATVRSGRSTAHIKPADRIGIPNRYRRGEAFAYRDMRLRSYRIAVITSAETKGGSLYPHMEWRSAIRQGSSIVHMDQRPLLNWQIADWGDQGVRPLLTYGCSGWLAIKPGPDRGINHFSGLLKSERTEKGGISHSCIISLL